MLSGAPESLSEAEGHITDGETGKPPESPAQPQTLKEGPAFRRTHRNFLHGNREAPRSSAGDSGPADRSENAQCRSSDRHEHGESDDRVVPEQTAKEGGESFWSLYQRFKWHVRISVRISPP